MGSSSFGRTCRRVVASLLAIMLLVTQTKVGVAEVIYMADVTEQMSDPTYWSSKQANPHRLLADLSMIGDINASIVALGDPFLTNTTNMTDLAAWSAEFYDAPAMAASIETAVRNDAAYYFNGYYVRHWIKADGSYQKIDSAAQLTDLAVANCPTVVASDEGGTDADDNMVPYSYAICTAHSCVLGLPLLGSLLDGMDDMDYDYNCQTALRVNEPMIIDGVSADGGLYHVVTSCTRGWVDANDVAVCADRDEWLEAWSFPSEETLVICESKVVTEDSNNAPQTANRELPLGTCLKLATPEEAQEISAAINRTGHNNHVVWLPVRNEDGTYSRTLGLISEHYQVSEGYLPLTAANISKVALSSLGDTYGWGGALHSDDCSGLVRDTYKCFGLELARNTTWQSNQPVAKYSLAGMSDEDKAEFIESLPLGATLFMNGHEMLYLGYEGENLYVVSSISRAIVDDANVRVRGVVINTLNTKRASGATWLQSLDLAEVPFYAEGYEPPAISYACTAGSDTTWIEGDSEWPTFSFERSVAPEDTYTHFVGLRIDGRDVDPSNYTAEPGSVVVKLDPAYLDTVSYGEHSLEALFDDGDGAAVSFTVQARAAYAVNVQATSQGVVTANHSTANEGQEVVVTAQANDGFTLEGVSVVDAAGNTVEVESEGQAFTFAMPANDVSVAGSFSQNSSNSNSEENQGESGSQEQESGKEQGSGQEQDSETSGGNNDGSGNAGSQNAVKQNTPSSSNVASANRTSAQLARTADTTSPQLAASLATLGLALVVVSRHVSRKTSER